MKNKTVSWIIRIQLVFVALLLVSLFTLSGIAANQGYDNLLMVTPSGYNAQHLNLKKLDELSVEFLLTYESRSPVSVQAVNSHKSAMLIGTNHNYAGIMGFLTLNGGFFTEDSEDAKSKHAVLNETAAFEIFGSINISGNTIKLNGEIWTIAGVIEDNDEENANIYVPASVSDSRVDSIMILLDKSITETYVRNALKGIGVYESGYNFINLSKLAWSFTERAIIAIKTALSVEILIFIITAGGKLVERFKFYRNKLRTMYTRELVKVYRMDLLKAAGWFALFVAGVCTVMALSLQILSTCLTWKELSRLTPELAAGDFSHKLKWLMNYQAMSQTLFWAGIILIILYFCFMLFARMRRTQTSITGNHEL